MSINSESTLPGSNSRIYWLIASSLLIKIVLLFFAQTIDSDAVERTFFAEDWINKPAWITHSTWGPFHYYITGIALLVWNNYIYSPVILNIILSALLLLPFYLFTKREFNENGAFIATCMLAFSPIIFCHSLMNMSEIPYLLFLLLAINLISKGLRTRRLIHFVLAGLFLTIASGIRFEAWLFIPIFIILIWYKRGIYSAIMFALIAISYPALDVVSHYIQDNHSLTLFFSDYPWNMHVEMGPPSAVDYLRRIWFLPFCWVIALGPIGVYIALKRLIKPRRETQFMAWYAYLFWVFFLISEISAIRGSIFLHSRFSLTITVLSIPFVAPYFNEVNQYKKRIAMLALVLMVSLSFIYNLHGVSPIPRLENQDAARVAEASKKVLTKESGIILDFWGWENPYYLGQQSNLPTHNIYLLNGADQDKVQSDQINALLAVRHQGIVVLARNSLLWQNTILSQGHLQFKFNPLVLNVKELFSSNEAVAWEYRYP